MEYAYPENGCFTCKRNEFVFDPEKDPIIEFGKSPAYTSNKETYDRISMVVLGVALGVLVVGKLCTPLGFLAIPCVIAETSKSVYGVVRSVQRNKDKWDHYDHYERFRKYFTLN